VALLRGGAVLWRLGVALLWSGIVSAREVRWVEMIGFDQFCDRGRGRYEG